MNNNQVITAVCHRGICGALVMDGEECFVETCYFGTKLSSKLTKFDLFEKESKVQANWNKIIDEYLESKAL